jgi:hypothetical protein
MAEAADGKDAGPKGPGPWVAPIRLDEVPDGGRHVELRTDEQMRAALATYTGVRALPNASASFDVQRQGRSGLRVTGEVRATVEQTCVVSLEPMQSDVVELIDVAFKPAADPGRAEAAAEAVAASEDDPPEPLIDGTVDLGALATEFLMLRIDPYPRKPDAVFEPPAVSTADEGPFAALARLKGATRNEK